MPWARLDDGFHDHPKVDGLSLAGVGLYTLCLTWAHRHRRSAILPGHITQARVEKVAGRQAQKLADELVMARLWEVEQNLGGYVIHDFSEYLPKERDPSERKEAGRKGAAKRWEGHSKPDGNLPATSMASDSSCASAPAFPTRPDPEEEANAPTVGGRAPRTPEKEKLPRPPDDLFDALTAACSINPKELTDTGRGAINGALAQLRRVGATPADIPRRAATYQRKFPNAPLTPTALAKQWAACAQSTQRNPSFWTSDV